MDENCLGGLLELHLPLLQPRFGGGELLLRLVAVLAHRVEVREVALDLLFVLADDVVLPLIGLRASASGAQPRVGRIDLAVKERYLSLNRASPKVAALLAEGI